MTDITAPPWSAIGQINNNAYGRCTGALVARDVVVTAAHCLYNKGSRRFLQAGSIHFVLGYDRGSYAFHSVGKTVTIGPGYDPEHERETVTKDWALIRLAEPAPAGVEPLVPSTRLAGPGEVLSSAGFGRDRSYALSVASPCPYNPAGQAIGMAMAECSIVQGYSGGPLLDAENRIVGTQVVIGKRNGRDFLLAVPAANWAAAIAP